jgi:hypothetical protein
MNPYAPPRARARSGPTSAAHGRSPAEKAFDWVFIPTIPMFLVLGGATAAAFAGFPVARALLAILATLYWTCALTKVIRAWRDPFGRVLRFFSAAVLVAQLACIAASVAFIVCARSPAS